MMFQRIIINPPFAQASRAFVGFGSLSRDYWDAAGESRETILAGYPYLESEDIDEALRYAAYLADDETLA